MRVEKRNSEWRRRLFYLLKVLILLGLLYIQYFKPEIKDKILLVSRWFEAIMFYITSILMISTARIALVYFYNRKMLTSGHPKGNFIIGINRITSIISTSILFVALFLLLDVNISNFLTSISIVAAALAILSKDYISNVINGLILMFADQVSMNDQIIVGETSGRITDITFLNTVLMNDDNELVYIPNTTMLNTNIINISKRQLKKLNVEFQIDALKKVDVAALESKILDKIKDRFGPDKFDEFSIGIIQIKRDFVHFKVRILIEANDLADEKKVKSIIQNAVLEYNDSVRP